MTKMEAVKEYLRLHRKLLRLHGEAADHISRRDNNYVFNTAYSMKYIAERIFDEYDVMGDYNGGGPSRSGRSKKR